MAGIGKLKSISECLKGVEFSLSTPDSIKEIFFKQQEAGATINTCFFEKVILHAPRVIFKILESTMPLKTSRAELIIRIYLFNREYLVTS